MLGPPTFLLLILPREKQSFVNFVSLHLVVLPAFPPGLEAFFGYGLFTHTRTSKTECLTVSDFFSGFGS